MADGFFNDYGVWEEVKPDPELDQEGLMLAKLITEWCEFPSPHKLVLNGPASFTGTGRGGVAVMADLIGMEEFKLRGAYLANKRDLVLTLAPDSAHRFQFIEVKVGEALEKFNGMRELLDRVFRKDTIVTLASMRKAQLVDEERQRMQEKSTLYDDNFGAW